MNFLRSGHIDSFARDNLPPLAQWPQIDLDTAGLHYPERLNAVAALVDDHVAQGRGDRIAIIGDHLSWSYGDLAERINRIANVLTRDLGMVAGNRVLLRAANTPMMVAAYLAVIKAGGVVVATMPMLRAVELVYPIRKARIALALCDHRLRAELETAQTQVPELARIVAFGAEGYELEALMAQPGYEVFEPVDTSSDDVCLIGFTSGTTGEPKGTMHFQRDLLVICDAYGAKVLKATPDDRFIGSAPLAFTFGLGGMVLFPFRIGAAAVLPDKTGPFDLIDAIERHKASVMFTAPTAYRAMLDKLDGRDVGSLRICVSAGETLPKPVFDAWLAKTSMKLMDGIGATELLHIFIAAPLEAIRPGSTGIPVPGYEAKIVDSDGRDVPDGTPGRLAVRGPIGCRYLADARQGNYVQNGWNITGDTYIRDQDGYFWYQARSDDMIISSGYNIAGPEVEACLLGHPDVLECGVVGSPCPERGNIVKAYVVLREGATGNAAMLKLLQDHVKAGIAPYKYPRAIEFVTALPKTASGKLQRFALRQMAQGEA
ncbi:MAG: 2-aminobenzoate-CoA ligase [Hyphomicrobiales bacterium]|nr:MAG: 2-aminobenzoate-CoA ligase [Hyphomicrobiales bacterium]